MGNGIGGRGKTKCCGDPSNVCCIKGGAVGVVHAMWQDTKVLTKVLQPTLVVFEFVERERWSLHNGERAKKGPGPEQLPKILVESQDPAARDKAECDRSQASQKWYIHS